MSVYHLVMRFYFSFLMVGLTGVNIAVAAPGPTPGDQDLIRERQERLLEEQRRRLEELQDFPGKQISPTGPAQADDSRCFPVKDIEIKGADSLSSRERESVLKSYTGQCLGVSQLNELLKSITNRYIDRGLVTSRAYLPQQDMSQGRLQVLVVEGTLESLKGADGSKLSSRELAMTFPGRAGSQLNLREIEQAIDQLNRLPSNRAQMELAPGSEVGGSAVLVKNNPHKPWRASFSRNNDGQKSTGEQQWGTGFEWDSPLGLADQLVLRGGHDAISDHQKTSRNAMLYYNLPWAWWSFSYTYSQSDYRSVAQGNGHDYKQVGDSANGGQLDNSSGGRVTSQKDIQLSLTEDLLNHGQGELVSEGTLTVNAASLDNGQGGILSATKTLSVTTKGLLNNQAGKLLTEGTASLLSGELKNSQGGVISARNSIDIHSEKLNNSEQGSIKSDAGITLDVGQPPGYARHRRHQQQPWRGDRGARNQCNRADWRHHQRTHCHHLQA